MLSFTRIFVLSILLLASLVFPKEDQRQYSIHGYAQGTDYSVKYFAADSLVTQGEIDSILSVIDSSMSLYKPYSLISRLNASAQGMVLDRHMRVVMARALEISKDTRGKFDVTVMPLVAAWGFGTKPVSKFPDSVEVKRILKCVGTPLLDLKGSFLYKKKPCVQIDLNGIAQGYTVDLVAGHLQQRGIKAFIVEIGGELRIKGPKPNGEPFRVGIEGPSDLADAEPVIRHTIALNGGAVTTSGNYRKFLQRGSKKITHLIDPKTGYPLDNSLISVTIYAKNALTADGYDNAVMAMSMEEALSFVSSRKNMEAYLIYHRKDGKVADTLTRGFKQLISGK